MPPCGPSLCPPLLCLPRPAPPCPSRLLPPQERRQAAKADTEAAKADAEAATSLLPPKRGGDRQPARGGGKRRRGGEGRASAQAGRQAHTWACSGRACLIAAGVGRCTGSRLLLLCKARWRPTTLPDLPLACCSLPRDECHRRHRHRQARRLDAHRHMGACRHTAHAGTRHAAGRAVACGHPRAQAP